MSLSLFSYACLSILRMDWQPPVVSGECFTTIQCHRLGSQRLSLICISDTLRQHHDFVIATPLQTMFVANTCHTRLCVLQVDRSTTTLVTMQEMFSLLCQQKSIFCHRGSCHPGRLETYTKHLMMPFITVTFHGLTILRFFTFNIPSTKDCMTFLFFSRIFFFSYLHRGLFVK